MVVATIVVTYKNGLQPLCFPFLDCDIDTNPVTLFFLKLLLNILNIHMITIMTTIGNTFGKITKSRRKINNSDFFTQ